MDSHMTVSCRSAFGCSSRGFPDPLLPDAQVTCAEPMAPHLTPAELDVVTESVAKHLSSDAILRSIAKARHKCGVEAPQIWAIRRAMAGATHKRGRTEKRGRRKKLTDGQVNRLFEKREHLVKSKSRYVPVREVVRSARVPKVSDTTALRYLRTKGVVWRRLREKPPRTEANAEARKDICDAWRRKPQTFWTETVDLIIDAKKYPLPGNDAAARRLQLQRVRGALRTRKEGLKPGFTRPGIGKHKFNPGGHVHILGGICGEKIVLWEEIRGRWCGQTAQDMYAGPIKRALQRRRPGKRSWLILEDNDPTGFKSSKGMRGKAQSKLRTIDQPPYSPDLNPLDFSLWNEVHTRTLNARPKHETKLEYKARLRKVALSMPRSFVRQAVQNIKKRAQQIFDADGYDIPRD